MNIRLTVYIDDHDRAILRSTGPHKSTYQIFSTPSNALRAKKRLQARGDAAIRKFHFGLNDHVT